jgi:hypothetical protein
MIRRTLSTEMCFEKADEAKLQELFKKTGKAPEVV